MPHSKSISWHKLLDIVDSVEADLSRVLQAKHSLGLSEFRALDALSRASNSELRMQELAAHLGLNQSSVSRMLERLSRADLAVRDLCPDDKRGVYAVLTKPGADRLKAARADYEKTLEEALLRNGADALLEAVDRNAAKPSP